MAVDSIILQKAESVRESLRRAGPLVVALSGGVDSAVLLRLAAEALGPDSVLAVTGVSESLGTEDLADARSVAAWLGVRHETLETREMEQEGYRRNAGDRCYFCRSELFGRLRDKASALGFRAVAYGAIPEDLGEVRPGMKAASELGVIAPLLDAGLTKPEIRALAYDAALPVRDKPAAACLSSRIPEGTEVTSERLRAVRLAESGLRGLGFRQVRVRYHGEIARIETDPEGEARLRDPDVRREAVARVREAGFRYVVLDLEGYRREAAVPRSPLYRIGPARESGQ